MHVRRQSDPAHFELRQRRSGRTIVLQLRGELDTTHAREVSGAIQALPKVGLELVVLDLSRLKFIDSAGLACVLELWSLAQRNHYELTVLDAPGQVRQALHQSGIDRDLPLAHGEP